MAPSNWLWLKWFRREKKVIGNPPLEKPVDRNFYFIFQSADGTMRVKHGVRRSDLQMILDQLAICAACPEISSLILIKTFLERTKPCTS